MKLLFRITQVTLLLLIVLTTTLKAQDNPRKGYIGVGLGPSFILGNHDTKTGTGLNLNLLNVGYVIGKGFGVTGTWMGGAHAFDTEATVHHHGQASTLPARVEVGYGALMIGPMYTLHLSDDSSLDFKLRVGSLYTSEKTTSESFTATSENRGLGTSLGVGYRKKIANRWSLMLSSDYYAGKQQFRFAAEQNAHILSLTAGVGFVM